MSIWWMGTMIKRERIFKCKNGKIKIVLDELQSGKNYEKEWVRKQISKPTKTFCNSFSIGIELEIHKGGRICYGMLMASVKPNEEQDYIKVAVAYTQRNSTKYSNSILTNDAYVYEGLPKEYIEAVCSSIDDLMDKKSEYPQCDIKIEDAANCEVGSSPMIFSIITKLLLKLIDSNSIEEILSMDNEGFTEKYLKGTCYALG